MQIGMDGRGQALDNVFVERLWRSVKYKDIYLNNYSNAPDLELGLERYFRFYNHERVHQSLDIKPRQRCILGMGNVNQKSTLVLLNFGPKFGVKLRDKHRRMDRWKISICNTFIIYYVLINKDLCIK
ncbi:MAG: integrase core domain-containing protein [Ignavibacteriales bacterium]